MGAAARSAPTLHATLAGRQLHPDFACRTAKLAIEIDGRQHLDAAAYDERRSDFLENLGWQVLR